MNRYTIYCTEEQTKKALKLGAPIKIRPNVTQEKFIDFTYVDAGIIFNCPTTEQMIGWLETKDIAIDVIMASKKTSYYSLEIIDDRGITDFIGRSQNDYNSRKEATLAAIDAALDYLIENKK